MFTLKGTIGLMVLCLVVLAIASCGGSANSPLSGAEAYDDQDAEYYPVTQNGQLVAEDGSLVALGLLTPRQVSEPFDPEDLFQPFDPPQDWWETIWLALHDSLVTGENEVEHTSPTYKGGSAEEGVVITGFTMGPGGIKLPVFADALVLDSQPGDMAFATFGFQDIPAGEDILTIRATGQGVYGDHDGNGLYIGVGNMENGNYKWYGPYAPDADEYEVSTWGLDTANGDGRGYVTFVVYNGDSFSLTGLEVTVGEHELFFPWAELVIPEMIYPGGYFNMDLINPGDYLEELPIPDPHPGI